LTAWAIWLRQGKWVFTFPIRSRRAEVLKLEKVGIRDNFFNLGGHSLLATQIISRMRHAFSIEVPLRQVFDAPTIAEMATIITENQVKRASAPKRNRLSGDGLHRDWFRQRNKLTLNPTHGGFDISCNYEQMRAKFYN